MVLWVLSEWEVKQRTVSQYSYLHVWKGLNRTRARCISLFILAIMMMMMMLVVVGSGVVALIRRLMSPHIR